MIHSLEWLVLASSRVAVRASDRDRNRVTEELRVHCVAGRITLEELERRVERAMSAQTIHQLAEVVYDLPTISVPGEARRPFRAVRCRVGVVSVSDGLRLTASAFSLG